jgi:hypothetical protein
MFSRPSNFVRSTNALSVTRPVTEIYCGPDPRRRTFLMALAAALLAGQTFADTAYQDVNPKIVDAKPPVLRTITADPPVITMSNRRLVPVTLSVNATDDVDWTPSCRVEAVESNQPSLTSAGTLFRLGLGPLPAGDGQRDRNHRSRNCGCFLRAALLRAT